MRIKYYFFLITLLLGTVSTFTACDDDDKLPHPNNGNDRENAVNENRNPTLNADWLRLEFPKVKNDGNSIVLIYTVPYFGVNFCVEWDCTKRAQRWSCYQMYDGNSGSSWKRNYWESTEWEGDPFQPDPNLRSDVRTELSDYYKSGYTRGHIVPSADRQNSKEANEQTYYLTNIQPQSWNFNGGIWLDMENRMRDWNKSSFRKTLYVCKGGTIDNDKQIIEKTSSGLIVPKYFFMAVLCHQPDNSYKAMAFWVEHTTQNKTGDNLANYIINIHHLEQKTGIDFFCNLPDKIEEEVENQNVEDIKRDWGFK